MRSAAWPTKRNGWAESDVQDAIEVQEKRLENVLQQHELQVQTNMENNLPSTHSFYVPLQSATYSSIGR
jgi:hypothetical protein